MAELLWQSSSRGSIGRPHRGHQRQLGGRGAGSGLNIRVHRGNLRWSQRASSGMLNEELIDIAEEKARTHRGPQAHPRRPRWAPAATSSISKKKPEQAARDALDRCLFEVFKAAQHPGYFPLRRRQRFPGHHRPTKSTSRPSNAPTKCASSASPKTIDNDLPHTDHCPGYGSAVKYSGATVMEGRRRREKHGDR